MPMVAAVPAYVGPGAGLALAGGVWGVTLALLALLALLTFPLRLLAHGLRHRRRRRRARARRVVVVGFDGLDDRLVRGYLEAGLLPELADLAASGSLVRLDTVLPAITPAAWSSFATGVDPSRHAIFDFVARDPHTYRPLLATAEIRTPTARGRPWRRRPSPHLRSLRRSRPFWSLLADCGVTSTILRVPVTWPPEPFGGLLLSGLSTPDLRGTQGEGTLLSTAPAQDDGTGPRRVRLEPRGTGHWARLPGPSDPGRHGSEPLSVEVTLEPCGRGLRLCLDGVATELAEGADTPWLPIAFPGAGGPLRGLCRARLLRREPPEVYLTPLQIDPGAPAMPVSHPGPFAAVLARRLGPFATLGLAEDTEALNAGVLDEAGFLAQAEALHREREAMLCHALGHASEGVVACVFDGSDRIQHMFYRGLEPDHPAHRSRPCAHPEAVADAYRRADATVGRVRRLLRDGDVLLVLSDHGFTSFRRGVDLNAWLLQEGYLHLREGCRTGSPWLADVDWARTRAYALGLSGLYLNLRDREGRGIVAAGQEYDGLKGELVARLCGLRDPACGRIAIERAYDTTAHYAGPYASEGPDILVGYGAGYRVAWSAARGAVSAHVFADNDRPWSGDHCVEPSLVPGVLFSSRPLAVAGRADIVDVPVTILRLLGVEPPAHMQGRDLFAAPVGHGGP